MGFRNIKLEDWSDILEWLSYYTRKLDGNKINIYIYKNGSYSFWNNNWDNKCSENIQIRMLIRNGFLLSSLDELIKDETKYPNPPYIFIITDLPLGVGSELGKLSSSWEKMGLSGQILSDYNEEKEESHVGEKDFDENRFDYIGRIIDDLAMIWTTLKPETRKFLSEAIAESARDFFLKNP